MTVRIGADDLLRGSDRSHAVRHRSVVAAGGGPPGRRGSRAPVLGRDRRNQPPGERGSPRGGSADLGPARSLSPHARTPALGRSGEVRAEPRRSPFARLTRELLGLRLGFSREGGFPECVASSSAARWPCLCSLRPPWWRGPRRARTRPRPVVHGSWTWTGIASMTCSDAACGRRTRTDDTRSWWRPTAL